MAYADQEVSGNRIAAFVIVALLHVALGYALVTGLAYEGVKQLVKKVTTVDIKKDEPKKDDKADDLAARVVTANARAVQAELRTAAALAGVPKERIPYVLRMCDTEGIDLDAADAQDKLDAAVAKVLEAVPELRGGTGTGSTGNFARRNGGAEDALDAKIRANIMGAC